MPIEAGIRAVIISVVVAAVVLVVVVLCVCMCVWGVECLCPLTIKPANQKYQKAFVRKRRFGLL